MKIILCCALLCIVAVFTSPTQGPGFDEEKTYTYDVQGQISSANEPTNQQQQHINSQVGYKIKVTRIDEETLHLNPSSFRILGENAGNKQIPSQLLEYLESPIEIIIRQGKLQAIRLQAGLPVYAVNIKKLQLAPFLVNTQAPGLGTKSAKESTVYGKSNVEYKIQQVDENNQLQQPNQQQSRAQQQQNQQFGAHQQQQQSGRINNQQRQGDDESDSDSESQEDNNGNGILHRLASYLPSITSNEQGRQETPTKKFCNSEDQTFQIVRTYKVADSVNIPSYSNDTRSSQQINLKNLIVVTTLLACGPSRSNYEIIQIERVEKNLQRGQPRNTNQESSETVQSLVLTDISSTSVRRLVRVGNPYIYVNAAYNFNVRPIQPHQQPYGSEPQIQHQLQQQYQTQRSPQGTKAPSTLGHITLYQNTGFTENLLTMDITPQTCQNVPADWNDVTSSVDVGINCYILWEHYNCEGSAVRLERYSYGSQNLDYVHMNDKVSAIQMCFQ